MVAPRIIYLHQNVSNKISANDIRSHTSSCDKCLVFNIGGRDENGMVKFVVV